MTTSTPPDTSTAARAPRTGFEGLGTARLDDWRETIAHWHAGLERTIARCRGMDAPFCHGEHGNMHALMSGAQAAGLSTMREVLGNRDDAAGNDGRLDGCFIGDQVVDLVEAKWTEAPLGPDGRLTPTKLQDVRNALRDAATDAGRYFNRHGMFSPEAPFVLPRRRIAITFSCGYFKADPGPGSGIAEAWLENHLAQFRDMDADFMAWSYPAAVNGLRYWSRHYPGVVMLARLVHAETPLVLASSAAH